MEVISNIIVAYNAHIAVYAALMTLAVIIMATSQNKRKRRYMVWKKDRLNLFVFTREWERNNDMFTEELLSENMKLSEENKALKSNVTHFVIIVFIIYVAYSFEKLIKRIKN